MDLPASFGDVAKARGVRRRHWSRPRDVTKTPPVTEVSNFGPSGNAPRWIAQLRAGALTNSKIDLRRGARERPPMQVMLAMRDIIARGAAGPDASYHGP